MNIYTSSNKIVFSVIILLAITIVVTLFGAIIQYQARDQRIKATLVAAPTLTAEAIEFTLFEAGNSN